jgi:hypothetical protein
MAVESAIDAEYRHIDCKIYKIILKSKYYAIFLKIFSYNNMQNEYFD